MTHVDSMVVEGVARGLWQKVQRSGNLLDKHKPGQGTSCTLGHPLNTPAHTHRQTHVQILQQMYVVKMLNSGALTVVALRVCDGYQHTWPSIHRRLLPQVWHACNKSPLI